MLFQPTEELLDENSIARIEMIADMLEAILGAIYIDQGLTECRKFISKCLFAEEENHRRFWMAEKRDPHQQQPDRHLISQSKTLFRFTQLEKIIGYRFHHIKLLVQAFTHNSASCFRDPLETGNQQRLEFLGDAVLKLCVTRYLFMFFPTYQEGKLHVIFIPPFWLLRRFV